MVFSIQDNINTTTRKHTEATSTLVKDEGGIAEGEDKLRVQAEVL